MQRHGAGAHSLCSPPMILLVRLRLAWKPMYWSNSNSLPWFWSIPAVVAERIAWGYVWRLERQIWAESGGEYPDAAAIEAGALRLRQVLEQRAMEYALWGCGWLLALVAQWSATTMWVWLALPTWLPWTRALPDWFPWTGLSPPAVPTIIPRK
jgi:hypothetical protein